MITEEELDAISAILVKGETFIHTGCICTVTRRSRVGRWIDVTVTSGNATWRKRQALSPAFLEGVSW